MFLFFGIYGIYHSRQLPTILSENISYITLKCFMTSFFFFLICPGRLNVKLRNSYCWIAQWRSQYPSFCPYFFSLFLIVHCIKLPGGSGYPMCLKNQLWSGNTTGVGPSFSYLIYVSNLNHKMENDPKYKY